MRRLRSKWLLRCTALLLVGAMVPALLVPSSRAASQSLSSSYAEWILAQLNAPADQYVQEALEQAAEADVRSFDAFVETFLNAYEARHPQESAARVFTGKDLSNEALIAYLQRRYTEIRGDAVLLRLRVVAASPITPSSVGSTGLHAPTAQRHAPAFAGLSSGSATDGFVYSPHRASPARPQGP